MQPLGPIMGLFERLLPRLRGDPARASDCRPLRRSWLHLSCVRISPRLVSHEVCGGSTTEDASAGALGDRTGGWIEGTVAERGAIMRTILRTRQL